MAFRAAAAVLAFFCLAALPQVEALAADPLRTALVEASDAGGMSSYDGVVEAVRQTALSVQVAGAIVVLKVRAGDTVKAGQELLRIDSSAALQNVAASAAQVEAARASMNAAGKEYERQKQLFQKQYISQAALDRAQAQHEAAQAQVRALQAQTEAARSQSRFFTVNAPYAGVVSDVPVALGDMATPGRPLVKLHDPTALRVTAFVPHSVLAQQGGDARYQVELPTYMGKGKGLIKPLRVQVLPVVSAATHTVEIRLDLPADIAGLSPGMFARVWVPAPGKMVRLFVPAAAIVHRAEMAGLYVVNAQGRPILRQVRLGPQHGERIEILSGVQKGESIALDPVIAARVR